MSVQQTNNFKKQSAHERFDAGATPPLLLLAAPLFNSIEFRQFASVLFQPSIAKRRENIYRISLSDF